MSAGKELARNFAAEYFFRTTLQLHLLKVLLGFPQVQWFVKRPSAKIIFQKADLRGLLRGKSGVYRQSCECLKVMSILDLSRQAPKFSVKYYSRIVFMRGITLRRLLLSMFGFLEKYNLLMIKNYVRLDISYSPQ